MLCNTLSYGRGAWACNVELQKVIAKKKLHEMETTIFPNPAKNSINIQHSNFRSFKVEIFDINGTLVKSVQNKTQLEAGNLEDGIYIVHISANNKFISSNKLLIKKD